MDIIALRCLYESDGAVVLSTLTADDAGPAVADSSDGDARVALVPVFLHRRGRGVVFADFSGDDGLRDTPLNGFTRVQVRCCRVPVAHTPLL